MKTNSNLGVGSSEKFSEAERLDLVRRASGKPSLQARVLFGLTLAATTVTGAVCFGFGAYFGETPAGASLFGALFTFVAAAAPLYRATRLTVQKDAVQRLLGGFVKAEDVKAQETLEREMTGAGRKGH